MLSVRGLERIRSAIPRGVRAKPAFEPRHAQDVAHRANRQREDRLFGVLSRLVDWSILRRSAVSVCTPSNRLYTLFSPTWRVPPMNAALRAPVRGVIPPEPGRDRRKVLAILSCPGKRRRGAIDVPGSSDSGSFKCPLDTWNSHPCVGRYQSRPEEESRRPTSKSHRSSSGSRPLKIDASAIQGPWSTAAVTTPNANGSSHTCDDRAGRLGCPRRRRGA